MSLDLLVLFSAPNIFYFALAAYFGYQNYRKTNNSGFWLHLTLVFIIATIVAAGNFAKFAGIIPHSTGDIIEVLLGIEISVLLFTATYTLTKKHHQERVF